MSSGHDIHNRADIELLVNTFYESAQQDDLLGPVFNAKITDWNKHLHIMYTFWETVILDTYTYKGTPFNKHTSLPVNKEHFDRWVQLFHQVVDSLFEGENATNAKQRATQFGLVFWSKLEHLQSGTTGGLPIV